jgi:hypothetical protein
MGSFARFSIKTNETSITKETDSITAVTIRGSPDMASRVMARRRITSADANTTFPVISRYLVLVGRESSFSFKCAHNVAKMPIGRFTQNMDLQPRVEVRTPPGYEASDGPYHY